jgi:hypothetical protein
MSDDKSKTQPQDSSKVNVHEQYEVLDQEVRGDARTTKAAVSRVGTSAAKVEQDLKRR